MRTRRCGGRRARAERLEPFRRPRAHSELRGALSPRPGAVLPGVGRTLPEVGSGPPRLRESTPEVGSGAPGFGSPIRRSGSGTPRLREPYSGGRSPTPGGWEHYSWASGALLPEVGSGLPELRSAYAFASYQLLPPADVHDQRHLQVHHAFHLRLDQRRHGLGLPSGTSRTSSSWTVRRRRAPGCSSRRRRSTAIMASLQDVRRRALDAGVDGHAAGVLAQVPVLALDVRQPADAAVEGLDLALPLGAFAASPPCSASRRGTGPGRR